MPRHIPRNLQGSNRDNLNDTALHRGWKNRVKGGDWCDFAFLVRKKVPLLLAHFEAGLRQLGVYANKPSLLFKNVPA